MAVLEAATPVPFTATATLATGPINMTGIFVSTATGATIAVADGNTTIVAAFTPVPATFYPLPFTFKTAINVTVTGTLSATASIG